jgi:hypothetical protein
MKTLIALLLMTTAVMAAEDCDNNSKPGCNVVIMPIVRIPSKSIPTQRIIQPPFDTPSWVPDEETKKRALRRAYELNGDKMVGGMIDVSDDPMVTGVAPAEEKNPLDAIADMTNPLPAPAADICKRHGMRKVTSEDGRSWRCRK